MFLRSSPSVTDVRILIVGGVLWNPTIGQPSLVGPLVRVLCFPRPLDPSLRLLKRHGLRLPGLCEGSFIARTEGGRFSRQTIARANARLGSARVRSIVPRPYITTCLAVTTVEVLCTISHRRGPFANYHRQPVARA